jgi:hypothetical protein
VEVQETAMLSIILGVFDFEWSARIRWVECCLGIKLRVQKHLVDPQTLQLLPELFCRDLDGRKVHFAVLVAVPADQDGAEVFILGIALSADLPEAAVLVKRGTETTLITVDLITWASAEAD